jgi:hypothetical protein
MRGSVRPRESSRERQGPRVHRAIGRSTFCRAGFIATKPALFGMLFVSNKRALEYFRGLFFLERKP